MNFIAFLSFIILIITILTLVFGVITYFMYKAREKKNSSATFSYEEVLEEEEIDYIFFTQVSENQSASLIT